MFSGQSPRSRTFVIRPVLRIFPGCIALRRRPHWTNEAALVALVAAAVVCYPALRRMGRDEDRGCCSHARDELLEHADGVATRAIDIDSPAASVWPWRAQIGPAPRGGAYTYDWIENLLGLDIHSVDRVLPEFQNPNIGDTIGFGAICMRLERVEPAHVLAMRSQDGSWVWTFMLEEHEGRTRLISRNRYRLPTLVARIGMVPMESGSLVSNR